MGKFLKRKFDAHEKEASTSRDTISEQKIQSLEIKENPDKKSTNRQYFDEYLNFGFT